MEMINFGRTYAAMRLVKSAILNKLLIPAFAERVAAKSPQMVIFSSDLIGQGINLYGYWEHEELVALTEWLNSHALLGGTMLDVGANIGNHSVFLARHFDRVHSVEPNPRTFKVLSMNALLADNIHCHQIAASDANGKIGFVQELLNVGHSHVDKSGVATGRTIDVECWKLDDYLSKARDVRLIKIDVEGHELEALRGMERILERDAPTIVFEQHLGGFVDGKSDVIEFLRRSGYTEFHSIDRVPYMKRSGRLGKLWFFACSLLLGFRLTVRHHDVVHPDFYEMLIARKPAARA